MGWMRVMVVLALGLAACSHTPPAVEARAVWLPKLWDRKILGFAAMGNRIFATQSMGQAIASEDGGRTWHAARGGPGPGADFASDGKELFAYGRMSIPPSTSIRRWTSHGWGSLPAPWVGGHLFGTEGSIGLIRPDRVALWRDGRWSESISAFPPTPLPHGARYIIGGRPSYGAAAGERAFFLGAPDLHGRQPSVHDRIAVLVADLSPWTLPPPVPLGDSVPLLGKSPSGWAYGLAATKSDVHALVAGRVVRFPLARSAGPWLEEPASEPVLSLSVAGGSVYRTLGTPPRLERRDKDGRWRAWGAPPASEYLQVLGQAKGRLFVAAEGNPFWKPADDPTAPFQPLALALHSMRSPLLDGGSHLFLSVPLGGSPGVWSLAKDGGGWSFETLRPGGRVMAWSRNSPEAVSEPVTRSAFAMTGHQVHAWHEGRWHSFPSPRGGYGRIFGFLGGNVFCATYDDPRHPRYLEIHARPVAGGGRWRLVGPRLELKGQWSQWETHFVGERVCTLQDAISAWQAQNPLWCRDEGNQGWSPIPALPGIRYGVLGFTGGDLFLLARKKIWRLGEVGFQRLGPPIDLPGQWATEEMPYVPWPRMVSDGRWLFVLSTVSGRSPVIKRISYASPYVWEEIRWPGQGRIQIIDSISADAKRHALFLATDIGPVRLDLPD